MQGKSSGGCYGKGDGLRSRAGCFPAKSDQRDGRRRTVGQSLTVCSRIDARWRTLLIISLLLSLFHGASLWAAQESSPPPSRGAATYDSEIRLAYSSDGVAFTDAGKVFARHGAAPDLLRLANGELLAVFDFARGNNEKDAPRLSVSRSADQGRTWSPLRSIQFGGSGRVPSDARHPSIILMEDDTIRLYFVAVRDAEDRREGDPNTGSILLGSAVSRDGLRFRLDDKVRIRLRDAAEVHPLAANVKGRVHLFAALEAGGNDAGQSRNMAVKRFASPDGQRFEQFAPISFGEVRFVGDVVATDEGLRAYVSGPGGVVSLVSKDGNEWKQEEGLRVEGGWDPAVAQLGRGAYLMLYCSRLTRADTAIMPLVATASDPLDPAMGVENPDAALVDQADFAPVPDFKDRFDYFQWYLDNLLGTPGSDAYESYKLLAEAAQTPEATEALQNLIGRLQDPPVPWESSEETDLEQSSELAESLLSEFRTMALIEGYATPSETGDFFSTPDEKLLMGILLPHLSAHRTLVKAELADAWRMEDGQVSPARLLDAFETALRASDHLNQGAMLIEHLVARAERNLVQSSALHALQQGVLTGGNLEAGLEVLRQFDDAPPDPAIWVRGEHASSMDIVQYIYSPLDAEGEPSINQARLENIVGMMMNGTDDLRAALEAHEPKDMIASLDNYYQDVGAMVQRGYPQVRSADLDAMTESAMGDNPLAGVLLPSFARYHHLQARAEASRRGTQLTYAVHIFKDRNGRWPVSLDELPADLGTDIRIDPFSGRLFGYQVRADGPVIYSVGENGVDDGALHSAQWGTGADEGGVGDHIIWPPQPPPF